MPPLAVNIELFPGHTDAGFAEMAIFGNGFTVTVALVVPVHPTAFVPVTVYVVVLDGETDIELFDPPVLQLYMAAPLAVNVAVSPSQMI